MSLGRISSDVGKIEKNSIVNGVICHNSFRSGWDWVECRQNRWDWFRIPLWMAGIGQICFRMGPDWSETLQTLVRGSSPAGGICQNFFVTLTWGIPSGLGGIVQSSFKSMWGWSEFLQDWRGLVRIPLEKVMHLVPGALLKLWQN